VRKGKEVELPSETGMLARLDSTVTVPVLAANSTENPATNTVPSTSAANSGN
jgi:hypothetical protein